MKRLIFSLTISNLVGLFVFYLMYKIGIKFNIPLVKEYYIAPLSVVIAYLIWDNYKDIKKFKLQGN